MKECQEEGRTESCQGVNKLPQVTLQVTANHHESSGLICTGKYKKLSYVRYDESDSRLFPPPLLAAKNKFYGVLDSMLSFLKEWYRHTSIHLLVILHSENKKIAS